jgi:hypothetical protein
MPKHAERKYINPPTAADQLGVNADRIRQWITSGQLVAVNVGDKRVPRWRIAVEEWERFLQRRSNTAMSESQPTPRRRRRSTGQIKEFF